MNKQSYILIHEHRHSYKVSSRHAFFKDCFLKVTYDNEKITFERKGLEYSGKTYKSYSKNNWHSFMPTKSFETMQYGKFAIEEDETNEDFCVAYFEDVLELTPMIK